MRRFRLWQPRPNRSQAHAAVQSLLLFAALHHFWGGGWGPGHAAAQAQQAGVAAGSGGGGGAGGGAKCESIADTYFDRHHREPSPYNGSNLVYFLHVPRTAGRTFHTCFLKMGTPAKRQCPNTYDHLRMNTSAPNCFLLSSHDDFSMASLLPEGAAVLTYLRDPVERFLSAYEFAVEVAARSFQRSGGSPARKDPRRVNTEDVWPWSFLVPFFVKDMHDRRTKMLEEPWSPEGNWILVQKEANKTPFYFNKRKDKSKWNLTEEERKLYLPPLDPFNNPLVMSLDEFADHPLARELLHDNQAYQVLGITNYSHWGDAGQMRECMWESPVAQSHLLRVASERIKKFFHIGVTDRLYDSVAAAGAAMQFHMYHQVPKDLKSAANAADRKGGGRWTVEMPTTEQLVKSTGNVKLLAEVEVINKEIEQALKDMQSLKEQLFENNQAGKLGAEREALDTRIESTRQLLISKQATLAQLSTVSRNRTDALHRAKETLTKEQKSAPGTLGVEYIKCARTANAKNQERRVRSFTHLFMMDGRSIRFTKAARKKIPKAVIDKIRAHNPMDSALHAQAEEMLTTRRHDWEEQGILEELPDLPEAVAPEQLTQMAFKIPLPETDAPPATDHQDSL